jgi:transcriptional regulator GlxA family with amidase domain
MNTIKLNQHGPRRHCSAPVKIGLKIALSIAAWTLASCAPNAAPLPPPADAASREPMAQAAFVQALQPRRAGTPVVAVLALNDSTETTDFLLPHAVLQRAGVAQVQAVAPRRGEVKLYPAFAVEVALDLAGFDRAHPQGADYVIVPAMEPADDPTILAWLKQQAGKGARIISVCRGARVLGHAGLLNGRRFTGHWSDRTQLTERHAGATHVPHQRYVIDGNIVSATGITASVPVSLALVEAIAGRDKARAVADQLGVASWGPAHDSSRFALDGRRRWTYIVNKVTAWWGHERWRADVADGSDDIALALVADAWSRTGRVSVQAASASGAVTLRSGLRLIAPPADERLPRLPLVAGIKPIPQLDRTLCDIQSRHGDARHEWVWLELEYPGWRATCVG